MCWGLGLVILSDANELSLIRYAAYCLPVNLVVCGKEGGEWRGAGKRSGVGMGWSGAGKKRRGVGKRTAVGNGRRAGGGADGAETRAAGWVQ